VRDLRAVFLLVWAIQPYWAQWARPLGEIHGRHSVPVVPFGPKIIRTVHSPQAQRPGRTAVLIWSNIPGFPELEGREVTFDSYIPFFTPS
jgi:hypothetical protein